MLRKAAILCLSAAFLVVATILIVPNAPADPPGNPHVPDEVIIKFKDNASNQDKDQIRSELGGYKMKGWGRIKAELRKIDPGLTVEEAISRYKNHPKVQYIEPNYIVNAVEIPNDPQFPALWGMLNTGQTGGTAGADISATSAWDVFTGSSSALIGVIDTGVDYTHPDLAANIYTNPGEIPGNGIDDDNNGYIDDVHGWDFYNDDNDPMDDHGHGSHVSGTIGAVGNNGIGVAGVCWNVKILPLKFLSASGSGSTADAIDAVNYATMMGVDLTSNSWGGGGFSQALFDAISDANDAGQLFVAAAGNSGANTDVSAHYPSSYNLPNIISVAATDHNDQLASFSNYGATTVDLAAPGVDILSTFPGSSYGSISGTSMATPHVSGALGLVFGRFPAIGHLDAKNLILNFVDPLPNLTGVVATGGRLNAFFPIADPDSIPPSAVPDLAVTTTGSNWITLEWTAPGDDGNTGTASRYIVKYSTSPIDAGNFDAAMTASNPPDPSASGSPETMEIHGLDFSTTYYAAVKALDEFGNEGPVSNSPSGTTLGAPDIDVTPASLSATLISGATTTQNLTVSNVLQGTLEFEIPLPDLITAPPVQAAYVEIAKGDVDVRTGDPVIQGFGGPDGFGYRWVDSDEAFGPTFAWTDISGTGTLAISTGDDTNQGPFPIGFPFSFYGVEYNSFRVCSNGWLSFTSTSTAYSNQPLPNAGAPANMVAPFWDDLNPSTGGEVYYENDGTRLIVQWNNVAHYSSGGPYTFQAILNQDGTMDFQYLSMGSPDNSATVGIQNASGTDALQMAYNTAYIHDNLAVRIQAVPQWLTVSPTSGIIYAPGSTTLGVSMNAGGLLGGTYDGNVRIISNDPDEPTVTIPVELTVIGAPDISVSPASYDFGDVFIGATPTTEILVQNPGTDDLTINSIAIDDLVYSADMTTFVVPPRQSQVVTVTFSPTAVMSHPATMTILSDDPDEPSVDVSLAGAGVEPPDFSVSPTSLSSALLTGESEVQLLTLTNDGGADLEWSTGVEFIAASQLVTLTAPEPYQASSAVDVDTGSPDPTQGRTTPIQAELADLTGVDIMWDRSHGQTSTSLWTTIISDFESRGATVTVNNDPITPGLLAGYEVLWTVDIPTSGTWDPAELDALVNWVSGGGGLLFEGDNASTVTHYNTILTALGAGIEFSTTSGASGTTSNIYEHPTTENVNGIYLTANVASIPIAGSPGGFLFDDVDGVGAGAYSQVGAGHIVAISDEVFQNSRMDDADNQLFGNQVMDWLAGNAFLTLDPTSGIVAPGGTQDIAVTFDATGLFGGLYEANINIDTNDPLAPTVIVPAELQVTGAPDLMLDPASADFGDVYVGYPAFQEFEIFNSGTDQLTITGISSDEPAFTVFLGGGSFPINLAPLASTVIQLRFSPPTPTAFSGVLTINSNDPDTPQTLFPMAGVGLLPPVAGVSPTALHADLLTGETDVQQVTISNTGDSDLNWTTSLQFPTPTSSYTLTTPEPYQDAPDVENSQTDPGPGRTTPIQADLADLNGVNILWDRSTGQTSTSLWTTIIADFESRGATVTMSTDPITPALLSGYQVMWSVDTGTSQDWDADEKAALADWVNAGGAILLEGDNASSVADYNDLLSYLGTGITYSTTSGASGTTSNIYPHPTTENVNGIYLTANVASIPTADAPGGFLFDDVDGVGAGAYSRVGAGRIVAISDEVFQNSRMDDADNQLFGNQVMDWLATPVFLSLDPQDGVIPAGGNQVVDVTFDAAGLFGGDYASIIQVQSNDPANGVLEVNATMHVTGVPRIDFDPVSLDFGDVFIGYPENLTLTVMNVGTDVLSVSSIASGLADYSVDVPSFDLAPFQSQDLTVTFDPQTDGARNTDLTFMSNDPDSPHAVPMAGVGVIPPVAGVSPDPVEGAALPGGSKTKTLTLCNTGGSDLIWTAGASENTATQIYEELIGPKGQDVPGGEAPADPRPSIRGTGGPDTFGYTWIDSDEPGGPAFDWVDISLIGNDTDFPSYDIDGTFGPYPIGFNFPYYENSFSEFYVCNNGWISFTNGSSTAYSNQPLPNSGSNTPENMLAIWWDDNVYDESDDSYIKYHNDGTRLIIEYHVRRIAQSSPPWLNFEIILYPNGDVVYQYNSLGPIINSSTIGWQNGAKDDGQTIIFNDGAYPHTDLAILISSGPQWLSLSPESGVLPAGECVDIDVLMDAAELEAGDYFGNIAVTSNDPANPVVSSDVVFHVGSIDAADCDVDPNTINLGSAGSWITAYIELPPGYDPNDVLVETVLLNGVVPADETKSGIGDWNENGVPDWTFKFDRSQVQGILAQGDSVEVTVTGEIADTIYFTCSHYVRIINPTLNAPNGGESLLAGSAYEIRWSNPQGWVVDAATITYSPDGGQTWNLVAENVTGNSFVWTVPSQATQEGMIRVYVMDSVGILGSDANDQPFSVTTSVTGITPTIPSVYALTQNAPNPFRGATHITYDLPEDSKVELKIFDVSGRMVRVLENGMLPAGRYEASWDGRDQSGRNLASGIYFYRLEAPRFSATKRMFLLK